MNCLNFFAILLRFIALHNGELKVNAPQGTLTPEIVQRLGQFKSELLEFLQTSEANERALTPQFQRILR
jgi:TubC N-terminal docking domain